MKEMSQQFRSALCVVAATEQPQHRPLLPKLDVLAVDADEEPQVVWEAGRRCQGGTVGFTRGQNYLSKAHAVFVEQGVRHRSGSTGTNGTKPSWPQVV